MTTHNVRIGKDFREHRISLVVLKLEHELESPGELVKNTDLYIPPPEFLIQYILGGAQELVCLASSKVLLLLLVQCPHFENPCCCPVVLNPHGPVDLIALENKTGPHPQRFGARWSRVETRDGYF